MKKVVIFCDSEIKIDSKNPLGKPLPGTETSMLHLAKNLAKKGYTISFYGNCKEFSSGKIHYYPSKKIFRERKKRQPIIWVRNYSFREFMKLFKNCNNILLTSDSIKDLEEWYGDKIEKFGKMISSFLLNFNSIVFYSHWQVKNWRKNIKIPRKLKISVIYQIVDSIHIKKRFTEKSLKKIINTSHPRKSIKNIAKIAQILKRESKDYEFYFLGSPNLYQDREFFLDPNLEFKKFKTKFKKVVKFIPSIPNIRLNQYYSKSGIFLHPDYSEETGSLATIEAIAQGIVPIVSNIGSLPEIVGRGGIVLKKEDIIEEGVSTIKSLNQKKAKEIFKIQRDLIRKRYDPKILTAKWEKLFN